MISLCLFSDSNKFSNCDDESNERLIDPENETNMEYRNVPIVKNPRGQIVYCDCENYSASSSNEYKHIMIDGNNYYSKSTNSAIKLPSTSEESDFGHRRSVSVIHEWCKGQC